MIGFNRLRQTFFCFDSPQSAGIIGIELEVDDAAMIRDASGYRLAAHWPVSFP
jgi:hypothetical protein